jgi:fructokinase
MRFGGIEAGGTKWVCAIGDGSREVTAVRTFATTTPAETVAKAAQFFQDHAPIAALGVGSFGPLDLRPASRTRGFITNTPKPGWATVDLAGLLTSALGTTVFIDTDVNAAALAESSWGAGIGLETFCYVTVGTGIGAGVFANGRLLHGLLHPEIGHMRVPHYWERDHFGGACPFHGDCLEGLASGEAIHQRWGRPGEELAHASQVWQLEADYLADGLMNLICTLSPERIVVGGGVASTPGLLTLVRRRLRRLLADYFDASALSSDEAVEAYVVPPSLGSKTGVVGAVALASNAGAASEGALFKCRLAPTRSGKPGSAVHRDSPSD